MFESTLIKLVFVGYIICLAAVAYHQIRIKKLNIPLPDIISHFIIIILIGKLIWSTQTSHIDLVFGIIICFVATFMVGMIVGKSIGIPLNTIKNSNIPFKGSSNELDNRMNMINSNIDIRDSNEFNSTNDLLSAQLTGLEMDDDDNDISNSNTNTHDDVLIGNSTSINSSLPLTNTTVSLNDNDNNNTSTSLSTRIHYNDQFLQDIQYLSKRTLISITGMIESSFFSSQYVPTSWKSVKSEHPFMDIWTSHHFSTDGVLFHATMRVNATPEQVLQYLIEEGVETGLESIAFRNDLIQSIAPNCSSNNNNSNNNSNIVNSNTTFTATTAASSTAHGNCSNNNNNTNTTSSSSSSIRKLYVKSDSGRSVKRLFTVLTSIERCSSSDSPGHSQSGHNSNTSSSSGSSGNEMIVLSTRSVDLPTSLNNNTASTKSTDDISMNEKADQNNDDHDEEEDKSSSNSHQNHNYRHNEKQDGILIDDNSATSSTSATNAYIKGIVYGSGYILRPVIDNTAHTSSSSSSTNEANGVDNNNNSNNNNSNSNNNNHTITRQCDVTFAIHLDMSGFNIVTESQSTTSIGSAATDTSTSTTKTIPTTTITNNNNNNNHHATATTSAKSSTASTPTVINTTSGRANARKAQILLTSVQSLFRNMYTTFYANDNDICHDDKDNNNANTITSTNRDDTTTTSSSSSSSVQSIIPTKDTPKPSKKTGSHTSAPNSLTTAMTGAMKDIIQWRSKNVTNQIRQLYKEQLHHVISNNIQISSNTNTTNNKITATTTAAAAVSGANTSSNNHNNMTKRPVAAKRGSTTTNTNIINNNNYNSSNNTDNNINNKIWSDKSTASGSSGTGSGSSRHHIEAVPELETIFFRDGILILEHTDTDRVFGTVSATCHIDAPPEIVQAAIICLRSAVDGLLTCKNTLFELDAMTCIQWQTYKTPFPIGTRDFLLVHSQEAFYHFPTNAEARKLLFNNNNSSGSSGGSSKGSSSSGGSGSGGSGTKSRSNSTATATATTNNGNNSIGASDINKEGFIMSWASIDDICDDVDEIQESLERVANRSNINITEYTRTNLRTGGYVCVPCASNNNNNVNNSNNNNNANSVSTSNTGCDISLFFDADMWGSVPPWLAQVLAQVVVYEMLRELRIASFNLFSPPPSIKYEILNNNNNSNIYDHNGSSYHSYTSSSSSSRQHSQIDQILQQVERREKRMKMEINQNELEWNKMIAKLLQQQALQQHQQQQQQFRALYSNHNNNNTNNMTQQQQQQNRQLLTQQQQQQHSRNALQNSAGSNNSNNFKTMKLNTAINTSTTTPTATYNIEQLQQHQHEISDEINSPSSAVSTSHQRRPSQHPQQQQAQHQQEQSQHQQQQSQHQQQQSQQQQVKLSRSRSGSQSATTALAAVASTATNNGSNTIAPPPSLLPPTIPLSSSPSTAVTPATDQPADVSDFARDSFKRMFQYLGIDKAEANRRSLGLQWEMKVQKDGIDVESSMVNGSDWQAIRATTYINANKHTIRSLLLDDKRMNEYDDMFDFFKFLVNMDERTRVRRLAFKGIWPTSPRDFVVGTTWTELKNGTILIVSRSVPNVMGEQSGYVRGCVQVSGFLIQPTDTLPNDTYAKQRFPQGCKVTLCAHTELGGSLPSSIVNMLSTSAPLKMLDSIRNLVKPTPVKNNKK